MYMYMYMYIYCIIIIKAPTVLLSSDILLQKHLTHIEKKRLMHLTPSHLDPVTLPPSPLPPPPTTLLL